MDIINFIPNFIYSPILLIFFILAYTWVTKTDNVDEVAAAHINLLQLHKVDKDTLWLNVKDYGAEGDGITNDQTAIQDAIDALPANGGLVLFPEGIYLIEGLILVPDYVTLQGVGFGTKIHFDFVQDIGFKNKDYPAANHHIVIADMFMDGFDKTNDPIEFKACYKSIFKNLELTRGNHDGIELVSCYDCLLENIIAHNSNTYNGIELETCNRCIITTPICHNNPLAGIEIDLVSLDNLIVDGMLYNNTQYGLKIHADSHDNEAYGNMMRGNGTAPFLDEGTDNIIVGGHLKDCKARAFLDGDQLNLVSGTWTKVALNGESYDPGANFDAAGNNEYVVRYSHYYTIQAAVRFSSVVADKLYGAAIKKNGDFISSPGWQHSSLADIITPSFADRIYFAAGDTIQLWAKQVSGVNTVDISGAEADTFMTIDIATI